MHEIGVQVVLDGAKKRKVEVSVRGFRVPIGLLAFRLPWQYMRQAMTTATGEKGHDTHLNQLKP